MAGRRGFRTRAIILEAAWDLMQKAGWKQSTVILALGVSAKTIERYGKEHGKRAYVVVEPAAEEAPPVIKAKDPEMKGKWPPSSANPPTTGKCQVCGVIRYRGLCGCVEGELRPEDVARDVERERRAAVALPKRKTTYEEPA